MRHQLIPLWCAISVLTLLGACKKAEQPAGSEPKAEKPAASASAKPGADTDKGLLLKVKWPVGNRYVYRMDMEQHVTNRIPQMPRPMEQLVTMAMTYALSVVKELPEGGRQIDLEFLANEMDVKMGEQTIISFDSKEAGKNDNPITQPFRKMIGSKLSIPLNAKGEIDKIPGLEEWQHSLVGDQPSPAGALLAQQFGEAFFRQILNSGKMFPDRPVKIGETWPYQMDVPTGQLGKVSVDMKVRFKGWEEREQHKCVALEAAGTFQSSDPIPAGPMGQMTLDHGQAEGTSWFDPELGAPIDSASDQILLLKGQVSAGPQGGNRPPTAFTIEIGQKVKLTLVELGKVLAAK